VSRSYESSVAMKFTVPIAQIFYVIWHILNLLPSQ